MRVSWRRSPSAEWSLIWSSWWEAHASDLDFDPTRVFALKADYLDRALNAGLVAIEALPTPDV